MKTKSDKRNHRSIILVLIVSLLFVSISSAQTTVTVSQFYAIFAAGQTISIRNLDPAYSTVNIGKMGGPNIYDYSLAKLTPTELANTYSVSSIPAFAARFPGNAVTFGSSRDSIEKNPLFLLGNDTLFVIGQASVVPQPQYRHNVPYQSLVFPATYLKSYTTSGFEYDTTYDASGKVVGVHSMAFRDSMIVDGWGTLKIPGGQYECLRLKVLHLNFNDKEIIFLTREGVFGDIQVNAGQPDEGAVQVSDVMVVMKQGLVGVPPQTEVPRDFALGQNFPNPFNPTTTIQFTLPERSRVVLTVTDMLGRVVSTLVEGELEAGTHTSLFDGSQFTSGVYFYRLQAGPVVQTKKLVLIK